MPIPEPPPSPPYLRPPHPQAHQNAARTEAARPAVAQPANARATQMARAQVQASWFLLLGLWFLLSLSDWHQKKLMFFFEAQELVNLNHKS